MKRFVFLCVLSLSLPFFISAYSPLPKPTGFVTDNAGLFSAEEKNALEQNLSDFEKSSSNEIAVVTISSLDGDTIENFAVKRFEDWQIGKAKQDNGVLFLVSKDDRKMRIEVGYGLEGALTDALSSQIIRNIVTPAFREENYYAGVTEAVDAIEKATQGEYVLDEKSVSSMNSWPWETIIFFVFFGFTWIASILGRSKSWWL